MLTESRFFIRRQDFDDWPFLSAKIKNFTFSSLNSKHPIKVNFSIFDLEHVFSEKTIDLQKTSKRIKSFLYFCRHGVILQVFEAWVVVEYSDVLHKIRRSFHFKSVQRSKKWSKLHEKTFLRFPRLLSYYRSKYGN